MSVGGSWRETNEAYLDRADAAIEAGEPVAAWCALAAYLRRETLRLRVERVEGPVRPPGPNPRPEAWRRFMTPHPPEPWQRPTPSVPIAPAAPRDDGRSAEERAAALIARVEAFRGEPMDEDERALIRRCCGVVP